MLASSIRECNEQGIPLANQMELLQDFYEATLEALKEARNDRLWFKTNTKVHPSQLVLLNHIPAHPLSLPLPLSPSITSWGSSIMIEVTSLGSVELSDSFINPVR